MKSYMLICVNERELALLDRAIEIVAAFLDPTTLKKEEQWRCHEVARAVLFLLTDEDCCVVDGKYGRVDHSWIELVHDPEDAPLAKRPLLDVYSVGRFPQVQLIDRNLLLPTDELYQPGPLREDIRLDVIQKLTLSLPSRYLPGIKPSGERLDANHSHSSF